MSRESMVGPTSMEHASFSDLGVESLWDVVNGAGVHILGTYCLGRDQLVQKRHNLAAAKSKRRKLRFENSVSKWFRKLKSN